MGTGSDTGGAPLLVVAGESLTEELVFAEAEGHGWVVIKQGTKSRRDYAGEVLLVLGRAGTGQL